MKNQASMKQLLLDWGGGQSQTLPTFVVGHNEELIALLHLLLARGAATLSERFVYLWGESGVGKSHLLRALSHDAQARYIPADTHPDAFLFAPEVTLYLLDDCDKLSAQSQIAAFNLFNQVRDGGGILIAAGALPPMKLMMREDLRTRLGWGLIYQVHGLTDEEKIAALTHMAYERGLTLSPGVLPYLITHFQRDMRSLSTMLDTLDRYSLEMQRPITLPLLRSLLHLENVAKA